MRSALFFLGTTLTVAMVMLAVQADSSRAALVGDADCSGAIGAPDALVVLLDQAGVADANCGGDTDCDGDADGYDVLAILRHVAGITVGTGAAGACLPVGATFEPTATSPTSSLPVTGTPSGSATQTAGSTGTGTPTSTPTTSATGASPSSETPTLSPTPTLTATPTATTTATPSPTPSPTPTATFPAPSFVGLEWTAGSPGEGTLKWPAQIGTTYYYVWVACVGPSTMGYTCGSTSFGDWLQGPSVNYPQTEVFMPYDPSAGYCFALVAYDSSAQPLGKGQLQMVIGSPNGQSGCPVF